MENFTMPLSNFPNGFAGGVTIRGMPLLSAYPGKVFWVSSTSGGASNGNDGTWQRPWATLKYAVSAGAVTGGAGDIIVVKAGHTETITSATAMACSKAGIVVLGLGTGGARPTFTLNTANTATVAVSAANVAFKNCVFVANFLSIAACFTLSTATNFAVEDCLFKDTSGVLNFLQVIKSTGAANTANGLYAVRNRWLGTGTTSVGSFALVADALDDVVMNDNRIILERAVDASILLTMTTGACVNGEFIGNVGISKQTATTAGTLLNVGASSTGVVAHNYTGTLVTSSDKLFTTTVGLFAFENRVSGVVGATGFVIPAVDS